MYVILAAIWIWAAQGLWNLDAQAWLFVVVLAVVNLIFDFVYLITGTPWEAISVGVVIAVIVLILALLPGTKAAYDQQAA